MDRLTQNDGKGNWQLKGLPWEELSPGKELTPEACQLLYGALYKLKDLEDAGLHPKSAEAIDWLYLEKCQEVNRLKKELKEKAVKPERKRLIETLLDLEPGKRESIHCPSDVKEEYRAYEGKCDIMTCAQCWGQEVDEEKG